MFSLRTSISSVAIALMIAAAPLTSFAHADHGKPQYGGIFGEAGKFQTELVAKEQSMTIYLTNHGEAVSAKGASGKLTLLTDGLKTEIELKPSDDGKVLQAKGQYTVKKGTKGVATITLPGEKPASVRYEVK
jgi:hypothetical protein